MPQLSTMVEAGETPPLVVFLGREADGYTYALDPRSKRRIQEQFPETHMAPRVFIAADTRRDFEQVYGPVAAQLSYLLTGLSEGQLAALGGIQVVDAEDERTLWPPSSSSRSKSGQGSQLSRNR